MIVWIIGQSASGKTTLGRSMHGLLQHRNPATVFIDGDLVREIMGNDLGHTVEDRWINAQRVSQLCLLLDRQKIDVVCAVLSIFHDSQRWNREHLSAYKEIYLDVSMDTLRRRDTKGIYVRALKGELKDVVGVDIEFKPPYAPDLVINNDQDDADIDCMARKAINDLGIKR